MARPAPEPVWLAYHLVPTEEWEKSGEAPYLPAAYPQDGFIHTSHTAPEVAAAGNRYYAADPRPYVALAIDLRRLTSPWRYDGDARFPHIYGPLNRDAVLTALPAPRAPDGAFLPPTFAVGLHAADAAETSCGQDRASPPPPPAPRPLR